MSFRLRSFLYIALGTLLINVAAPTVVSSAAHAQSVQAADKKAKSKSVKKTTAVKQRSQRTSKRPARVGPQTEDGRWAALVIDADSGRRLFSKNADATRHPASLTKMMTLYLVFENLKKGRWDMDTQLVVSDKAAEQPATNISLTPGDRISVKLAIESLIVRSANDVAMVVAEALGETQWNFALMMNQKARQLGMRNTIFYNPSGLPDTRQVTTATDMAKLGIALRRDFPEYYHYFKITEFDYMGRTYEGHNRLLGRYAGTDGIKTGYIAASGYNLVTSVIRGDRHLVGVIMGGRTGAARDQEMMNMLDRTFIQLAAEETTLKPVRPIPALAPVPATPAEEAATTFTPPQEEQPAAPQTEAETEEGVTAQQATPFSPPTPAPVTQPTPAPVKTPPAKRREEKPTMNTPVRASEKTFAIQVGTFSSEAQAQNAVKSARVLASEMLKSASPQVSAYTRSKKTYWRGRLSNLSEQQARQACSILASNKKQCMVIKGGK